MTHSQRRINQEPVGGTLLCRACHLTVFKLLVQRAPPPPPPTTSSHLMQRHVTKNKLGVSSQRHLLHWSARYTSKHGRGRHKVRAEQHWVEWFKLGAACHPSGAFFSRQFWRDWSLPSSPTTAENTFKWLISNQNATNKFQCVTMLKRTKGYF